MILSLKKLVKKTDPYDFLDKKHVCEQIKKLVKICNVNKKHTTMTEIYNMIINDVFYNSNNVIFPKKYEKCDNNNALLFVTDINFLECYGELLMANKNEKNMTLHHNDLIKAMKNSCKYKHNDLFDKLFNKLCMIKPYIENICYFINYAGYHNNIHAFKKFIDISISKKITLSYLKYHVDMDLNI